MSRKAVLLVSTNPPSPEQEEEYNNWYDDVHVPQLLERIPGVVGATRYAATPYGPPITERYLTVFDIEADDPAAVVQAIFKGAGDGLLDFPRMLDTSPPPAMVLYEPME